MHQYGRYRYMKTRTWFQQANMVIVTLLCYACSFNENVYIGGIIARYSHLFFYLFIATLVINSIISGYRKQYLYLIPTISIFIIAILIDKLADPTTLLGYGIKEVVNIIFHTPLARYPLITPLNCIITIILFFLIGFTINEIKSMIDQKNND